jgi:uncharacterized membrane protein YeaQ/YmgE (transglycosylase-associated protein family)
MIGMGFPAFLTLLVLGFISSLAVHVLARYRVLTGVDGFMCKWIAGWIGGWLGSPILGHWSIHTGNVYIVPAILGAFAGSFLMAALFKASAATVGAAPRQMAASAQAGVSLHSEMRKVS